jgi:hypothetical protein
MLNIIKDRAGKGRACTLNKRAATPVSKQLKQILEEWVR